MSIRFILVPEARYCSSLEDIQRMLQHCMAEEVIAIDTETLGFAYGSQEDQALYMGISPNVNTRYFVPRHLMHYVKPLLTSNKTKVFHNYKFDAHRIQNTIGVQTVGPIVDTAILHALLNSESAHSLDFLSETLYDIPMAKYKAIVANENPRKLKPGHPFWPKFLDYGTLDALITRKLYDDLVPELQSQMIDKKRSMMDFYWRYEEPQMLALYEMERRGVRLDMDLLNAWNLENQQKIEEIRGEICKAINKPLFNKSGKPFNPSSSDQCAKLLYSELGLPVIKRTASGKPAADEETLLNLSKQVDSDILQMIISYRKVVKLQSTYADAYLKCHQNGRIHTSFNCVGTATGRLSSSSPNLQNVPPAARKLFVPDPGYIMVGADYSQLELRIVAHFSQEPAMLEAFHTGKDVHLLNVAKVNDLEYEDCILRYKNGDIWMINARSGIKAVVYGISYGSGARRTAQSMSMALGRDVSIKEAQDVLDKFFQANPKTAKMMKRLVASAKRLGYSVTICGRRRYLPNIKSRDGGLRSEAERAALNAPIQGTAADITKCALINCWKNQQLRDLGVQLLLQIHDEIIFQVPEVNAKAAMRIIQTVMEDPFEGHFLSVSLPASPDTGTNWSQLK